MKQKETLHLIRSRCVELLEQAKLRTPGAWAVTGHNQLDIDTIDSEWCIATANGGIRSCGTSEANAIYIANASAAFEAALESTVAAIDGLMLLEQSGREPERGSAAYDLGKIIAAWQHLLP